MAMHLRGAMTSFRKRFSKTGNVALGPVSFALAGEEAPAVARSGINDKDRETPFLLDDVERVIAFYPGYQNTLEYKRIRAPYAETRALRLGEAGFPDGRDMLEYELRLLAADFTLPKRLEVHGRVAWELFQSLGRLRQFADGRWENNISARVVEWDDAARRITLQKARYSDQVATNLTLDWASELLGEFDEATLRQHEPHEGGRLCPLNQSMLANTLGVAAVLVDPDDAVLVRIRGERQAIMAGRGGAFHCSASGVFELPDGAKGPATYDFGIFMDGMHKEIRSELTLERDEYDLIPLAFSRELVRGGKPQLFFLVRSRVRLDDLSQRLSTADEAWEFFENATVPRGSALRPHLSDPLAAPDRLFTYEGLMAFAIADACLSNAQPPFAL